jgi:hypothetical protein
MTTVSSVERRRPVAYPHKEEEKKLTPNGPKPTLQYARRQERAVHDCPSSIIPSFISFQATRPEYLFFVVVVAFHKSRFCTHTRLFFFFFFLFIVFITLSTICIGIISCIISVALFIWKIVFHCK